VTDAKTPIDPRLATRNRQPGLDLLRALAIVFVVFGETSANGEALGSVLS
jgi:peptidoglycan/LPS O-acetylase OafA/YrhL